MKFQLSSTQAALNHLNNQLDIFTAFFRSLYISSFIWVTNKKIYSSSPSILVLFRCIFLTHREKRHPYFIHYRKEKLKRLYKNDYH